MYSTARRLTSNIIRKAFSQALADVSFTSYLAKYSQTIFMTPTNFFSVVKISWYLTSFQEKNKKAGSVKQQSVDWHAIRCLSHCPAVTLARELLLRAQTSICPPATSVSVTHENSPGSACYCTGRQAGRQSIPVCNQLFSCLNGTRDYNFNPDMSHLQELITADKVIPQSVPQGRCKNTARVNAVCFVCFFFTSMRFNKRNPGASAKALHNTI